MNWWDVIWFGKHLRSDTWEGKGMMGWLAEGGMEGSGIWDTPRCGLSQIEGPFLEKRNLEDSYFWKRDEELGGVRYTSETTFRAMNLLKFLGRCTQVGRERNSDFRAGCEKYMINMLTTHILGAQWISVLPFPFLLPWLSPHLSFLPSENTTTRRSIDGHHYY